MLLLALPPSAAVLSNALRLSLPHHLSSQLFHPAPSFSLNLPRWRNLPSLPLRPHFLSLSSSCSVACGASAVPAGYAATDEESERVKLAQVSKRLENTSRYFKQLGSIGFWGQLVCTLVSAVILSFSSLVTGKMTTPITFYTTAAGIAAAFVSPF
ncbi:hypothetical protein HPP92_008279 [Vanilla planifolia]|uniref:Uncharacterized protein n=1 Tax=Vanilla planifolia TaxID=51239 RepID=A0A835RA52_VANPL|nr:hypothetical protein HPP92_008279 [Vanilla planifolia]